MGLTDFSTKNVDDFFFFQSWCIFFYRFQKDFEEKIFFFLKKILGWNIHCPSFLYPTISQYSCTQHSPLIFPTNCEQVPFPHNCYIVPTLPISLSLFPTFVIAPHKFSSLFLAIHSLEMVSGVISSSFNITIPPSFFPTFVIVLPNSYIQHSP